MFVLLPHTNLLNFFIVKNSVGEDMLKKIHSIKKLNKNKKEELND